MDITSSMAYINIVLPKSYKNKKSPSLLMRIFKRKAADRPKGHAAPIKKESLSY